MTYTTDIGMVVRTEVEIKKFADDRQSLAGFYGSYTDDKITSLGFVLLDNQCDLEKKSEIISAKTAEAERLKAEQESQKDSGEESAVEKVSGLTGGAIAGITVGSIVFMAIIAVLVICLIRCLCARRKKKEEEKNKIQVMPSEPDEKSSSKRGPSPDNEIEMITSARGDTGRDTARDNAGSNHHVKEPMNIPLKVVDYPSGPNDSTHEEAYKSYQIQNSA